MMNFLLLFLFLSLNEFLMINMKMFLLILLFFMMMMIVYFKNFTFFYTNVNFSMKLIFISIFSSFLFLISKNLLFFFLFFEISIFPIFFYMLFFSISENKFISMFYLIIFTGMFSMMFLFFMMIFIKNLNNLNILMIFFLLKMKMNIFNVIFMMIFFTKIPIFLFHIWLPKAHVESSSFGSMILAGILLKLGGFGLMILMSFQLNILYKNLMMIFLMLSSIFIIIQCFYINDLKMVVAYFSVSHMSLVLISLLLNMINSYMYMYMMMMCHALSSSMLFLYIMNFYNNYSSRMMMKISSLFKLTKFSVWYFFMIMLFNISIPPTMNFFSEMLIFSIIFKTFFMYFILVIIMFSISGLISIFILIKVLMNKEKKSMDFFSLSNISFSLKIFFMLILSMFLILNLNFI